MTVIFHSHKMFFLFVCLYVLKDLKEVIVVLKKKKKSTNYSTYIVILSAEARLETYLILIFNCLWVNFLCILYFLSIHMLLNIILYHFNNGAITYIVSFDLTWLRNYSSWSFIWKGWGLVIWIDNAPLFSIFSPSFSSPTNILISY